jgi:DNA-binding winged helix-turn-helix (wHTH) protein/tetratricopeptide (TPR) repeat protein
MRTSVEAGERRINLARVEDFDLGSARVRPSLLEISNGDLTELAEPRVMQMLIALHRARGTPVSREELIDLCWGGLAISDDAITQCVSKLRRALAAVAGVTVSSVPRIGYRLVVDQAAIVVPSERRRVARRTVGLTVIVAAVSVLSFDTASLATAGGPSTNWGAEKGKTAQGREAERLHEAAVRIFRERTRPGYFEAEKLLRRAVAIDPDCAPAWARLSMAVYAPYWWASEDEPEARARLRSEAIGYARRALSIDPNLAEGQQAMGFVLWDARGVAALERAAALDPSDGEIRQQLADLLEERLELRRALEEALKAVELEPTAPRGYETAAHLLDRLGHRAEADAMIDRLQRVTQRANEARIERFGLRFARGQLADAALLAAQSLDLGDENRWWAQSALLDVASALGDRELRDRLLRLQPKLADTVAYENPAYAVGLARTRPHDWWADQFVGGLARQLVATGNERLLLSIYDDRFQSVDEFWGIEGETADMVAPSLILALRRLGRKDEALAIRDWFASDIDKMLSQGDRYVRPFAWRAQLAALDGSPADAARWLKAAVDAGWKGHAPYRLGFEPDHDPVMALVHDDPRVQRAIAYFRSAVSAEAASLRKLNLLARPWARAVQSRSSA